MFIKGFDKDLKCRGYQFEIGGVYDTGYTKNLKCCSKTVFHFCESLVNVHKYYNVIKDNRFCEIEVLGELIKDDDKYGSNKIKIVREIVGDELRQLKMLTNGNTGVFNTGHNNIGHNNIGHRNTGHRNTGHRNTGDRNAGYYNTGDSNTGDRNTGDNNTGDSNTGDRNTGDNNTGYYNTGDCNTGHRNTGHRNTGHRNTGDRNTGDCNTGDCNTGDCNTGDCNTGYFNSVDFETGFFNTKESTVRIFNKKSNLKPVDFYNKYGDLFCGFTLIQWVAYTEKEKENSVIRQCLGGYLKEYTFEEASLNWYQKLKTHEKELLFTIPNFDCDVFEEITGLDVRKDFESYGPNTKEK